MFGGLDGSMDDILFFNDSSSDEQEELPWGKEWVNTTKDPKRVLEVLTIYSTSKGLLLITGEFKQFLFARQSITKQLLEALDVWVLSDEPVHPLITCYVNRKAQHGINKSGKLVYWHKTETKFYSTRVEEPLSSESRKALGNPFLAQTIPPDQTRAESDLPKGKKQPKNATSDG